VYPFQNSAYWPTFSVVWTFAVLAFSLYLTQKDCWSSMISLQ
jgi:hypothetical protein